MRFLILVVMMFAGAGSAMADVTISLVDNWDGTADIVVVVTAPDLNGNGDSLVAGIALDVSVDNGEIIDVTNFMTTGVSVDGAEGMGIYMGEITFELVDPDSIPDSGDEYTDILDVGTPVAPPTAPDNPGQLGTSACVLEFGCLFNVNVPADAPLATTTLCTVTVSESTTIHLAENDARGGVVMIGGGRPSALILNDATVEGCCGIPGLVCCYNGPDMDEWCSVGSPASWCYNYQCRGDVDGLEEIVGWVPVPPPNGTDIYAAVGPTDLGLFLSAYRVPVGQPGENLAADVDHLAEIVGWVPVPPPNGTDVYARTGPTDLGLLLGSYRVPTDQLAICP